MVNVEEEVISLLLRKMNQNPQSNYAWKDRFTWFKYASQYRALDIIDGESMVFEWNTFPGFTTLQLVDKFQKFMNKMANPSKFKWRIIFMSIFNDISWRSEDNDRKCNVNVEFVSKFAKRFPAGRGSFLGLGSEKKWCSKGEWTESLSWWCFNSEKADTQFFEPWVHCPEERSKAKVVENYQYFFALMRERLKLLFTQLFLFISSVSTVHSQMCVRICQARTGRPVLAGQPDPLLASANLLILTPKLSLEILAQEIVLQKNKERVERFSQQNRVIKFCIDAGFRKKSWSRTIFHDKAHWRVLTISRVSDVSWVHFTTRWQINGPEKLDLDPYWKSQPVICKVNTKWKFQLNQSTKTILTRGSEFLMDWTSWSQTWSTRSTTTTSRRPLKRRRTNFVKDGCVFFCTLINGKSKTKKTYIYLLMFKDCTYLWKNMDWYWTRSSIRSGVPSGKKNKHSNAARTIISRKRWSDRILETQLLTCTSTNGAVLDLFEECKTCHFKTGRLVLTGQSDPLFLSSVMKTHTHTHTSLTDDPAWEEDYCKDTKNKLKGYHNKIVWLNFVLI